VCLLVLISSVTNSKRARCGPFSRLSLLFFRARVRRARVFALGQASASDAKAFLTHLAMLEKVSARSRCQPLQAGSPDIGPICAAVFVTITSGFARARARTLRTELSAGRGKGQEERSFVRERTRATARSLRHRCRRTARRPSGIALRPGGVVDPFGQQIVDDVPERPGGDPAARCGDAV